MIIFERCFADLVGGNAPIYQYTKYTKLSRGSFTIKYPVTLMTNGEEEDLSNARRF